MKYISIVNASLISPKLDLGLMFDHKANKACDMNFTMYYSIYHKLIFRDSVFVQ